MEKMRFGLIGRNLEHSFSASYFDSKFKEQCLPHTYENLEFESIMDINRPQLLAFEGFNVTIPYKQEIISLLDSLSPEATIIGAVNCIEQRDGELIGHNTDAYGFRTALRPFLKSYHRKALILGTGGASSAVRFVLDELGVEYLMVSREPKEGQLAYNELNDKALEFFPFIVNTTPLGMFPDIDSAPEIPYSNLTDKNFLFDLVYNPAETVFLKNGREYGAQILNGRSMLEFQAEKSWQIWSSDIK
jgi:shikimate dehydrogenase